MSDDRALCPQCGTSQPWHIEKVRRLEAERDRLREENALHFSECHKREDKAFQLWEEVGVERDKAAQKLKKLEAERDRLRAQNLRLEDENNRLAKARQA